MSNRPQFHGRPQYYRPPTQEQIINQRVLDFENVIYDEDEIPMRTSVTSRDVLRTSPEQTHIQPQYAQQPVQYRPMLRPMQRPNQMQRPTQIMRPAQNQQQPRFIHPMQQRPVYPMRPQQAPLHQQQSSGEYQGIRRSSSPLVSQLPLQDQPVRQIYRPHPSQNLAQNRQLVNSAPVIYFNPEAGRGRPNIQYGRPQPFNQQTLFYRPLIQQHKVGQRIIHPTSATKTITLTGLSRTDSISSIQSSQVIADDDSLNANPRPEFISRVARLFRQTLHLNLNERYSVKYEDSFTGEHAVVRII